MDEAWTRGRSSAVRSYEVVDGDRLGSVALILFNCLVPIHLYDLNGHIIRENVVKDGYEISIVCFSNVTGLEALVLKPSEKLLDRFLRARAHGVEFALRFFSDMRVFEGGGERFSKLLPGAPNRRGSVLAFLVLERIVHVQVGPILSLSLGQMRKYQNNLGLILLELFAHMHIDHDGIEERVKVLGVAIVPSGFVEQAKKVLTVVLADTHVGK
jgi:hypothetical protein